MFIVHRYIDGLEAADAVGYRSFAAPRLDDGGHEERLENNFPAQDDNGKETRVINQPANPTGGNGGNRDGFRRTLRFIRCLLFNWSFLALVAFLLNLPVGTPILTQDNPAAPVTLIQFRNILFPYVTGTGGVTNARRWV